MSKGVPDVRNITPIGSLVAYDIALGLSYGDIAVHHKLTLDEVHKIARGNLVQKKVREFTAEIGERVLGEVSADPVRNFLAGKGMVAAEVLVREVENTESETGASATTRINAAKEVLALGGRTAQKEVKAPQMIINITADKVNRAAEIQEEVLKNVPDFVDGSFSLG